MLGMFLFLPRLWRRLVGLVMGVGFLSELRRRSNEFHLEPATAFGLVMGVVFLSELRWCSTLFYLESDRRLQGNPFGRLSIVVKLLYEPPT